MRLAGIPLLAAIVACASTGYTKRPEDLSAWQGKPLIELETQPHFAAEQRYVQNLSDGSQLWIYSKCRTEAEDVRCSSVNVFGTVQTRCRGGETSKACCQNQFIVRDGVVESYHLEGPCNTSCNGRPRSSPCDDH